MKTRPGICARKRRFAGEDEARAAAARSGLALRPYRCGLCRRFHLTSRTKGLRIPRPNREALPC